MYPVRRTGSSLHLGWKKLGSMIQGKDGMERKGKLGLLFRVWNLIGDWNLISQISHVYAFLPFCCWFGLCSGQLISVVSCRARSNKHNPRLWSPAWWSDTWAFALPFTTAERKKKGRKHVIDRTTYDFRLLVVFSSLSWYLILDDAWLFFYLWHVILNEKKS